MKNRLFARKGGQNKKKKERKRDGEDLIQLTLTWDACQWSRSG
jgi:hypothetical protein